jgi:AcrR family transcriptional regulator
VPRQRRTQLERRDDTRKRLLDAAFRVFARDGVAASVADIAAAANCSTGAIYTHFSGKRDLILAVFDTAFPDWANNYLDALSPAATPEQAIEAATQRWKQLLDDRPTQAQLYIEFWMAALRDPDLSEPFRQRQRWIIDTMSELIAHQLGAEAIASPFPAATVGVILTALADGFAMQYLAGTTADAADKLRTAILLIFHALTQQGNLGTTELSD